jgi:hypothetical protein
MHSMPEPGPQDEPDEIRDDMACRECGAAAGVPCGPQCECDYCLRELDHETEANSLRARAETRGLHR